MFISVAITSLLIFSLVAWASVFRGGKYLAIIGLGLFARLALLYLDIQFGIFPTYDVAEYTPYFINFASSTGDGQFWFTRTRVPFYTQLYPGWLYMLLGADSIWLIRLCNSILYVWIVWPVVLIFETVFRRSAPQLLLFLVLLWPPLLRYSIELGRTSPSVFFTIVSIAGLLVLFDRNRRGMQAKTVFLLAVTLISIYSMVMIRTAHISFFISILIFFLWGRVVPKRGRAVDRVLAVIVAVILIAASVAMLLIIYNGLATEGQQADLDVLSSRALTEARGSTSYLEGVAPRNIVDFFWYIPLHGFYFLFSPLPWDALSASNSLALVSSLLATLTLIWFLKLIIGFKQYRLAHNAFPALLLIISLSAMAMGSGVKNSGAAERWRSPITVVSLILFSGTVWDRRRRYMESRDLTIMHPTVRG